MDWEGAGLRERTLRWLEAAAEERYVGERRLDPFATSMRDFDDVSNQLLEIEAGRTPEHRDVKQRLTDLRAAALVEGKLGNVKLTPLGQATLDAWKTFGLMTSEKMDELPRAILLLLAAQALRAAPYTSYMKYWDELRSSFPPTALINNWDALYTINYLDHEIDNFAPGSAYRDIGVPPAEIEFDLEDFVGRVDGGNKAKQAAVRVGNTIGGKIPRGRARATFCVAMELIAQRELPPRALLEAFGYPEKPTKWAPFSQAQIENITAILAANHLLPAAGIGLDGLNLAPGLPADAPHVLSEDIDFSVVLQPTPRPPKVSRGTIGKGPKKVDHARKHERNQSIGLLGEQFALKYEQWRLRNHHSLRDRISHVSLNDDTLGYDILSWNEDETPRYVEVKSTQGPLETRFFLTASEIRCAESNPQSYVILRVANLNGSPICCEINYPFDELSIQPTVFDVTFKAEDS